MVHKELALIKAWVEKCQIVFLQTSFILFPLAIFVSLLTPQLNYSLLFIIIRRIDKTAWQFVIYLST